MTTTLAAPSSTKPVAATDQLQHPEQLTRRERLDVGKALREVLPRERHGEWTPPPGRRDPIDVLEQSNLGRLPHLIPIRYGRMLRSPFTFLRGSAGLMAADLASLQDTGLRVQACGDCHLLNFGLFATPERHLVFDMNDFDETLPAPWEWDLKRLTASFAVAARDTHRPDEEARDAAVACAKAYREHLRECSKKSPLEVWYERMDMETLIAKAPDAHAKKVREDLAKKARGRIGELLFPKIAEAVGGRLRLVDQPPLLTHVAEPDIDERFRAGMEDYRQSLPDDRRVLFDRYRLEDYALKVVGIGSVGTACMIALFSSPDGHPLLLQFKEANPSVLAPYAGPSVYENQGQRVVVGQRLLQSSSDIFLGWAQGRRGRHFFGRQLRDMKLSFPLEAMSATQLGRYAEACGQTLARAHAKSGDAATIAGYLGKSDAFDEAMGDFALDYADQTERDHAALRAAVRDDRVQALVEEDL
jgi:uncharacterized protein (DUF2252 family)